MLRVNGKGVVECLRRGKARQDEVAFRKWSREVPFCLLRAGGPDVTGGTLAALYSSFISSIIEKPSR